MHLTKTADHPRPLMLAGLGCALVLALGWAPLACAAATQTVQPSADLREHDFERFDPDYRDRRKARVAETTALAIGLLQGEASGRKNACAHQILSEVISLIRSSADFDHIDRRLNDLRLALKDPRDDHPDPSGLWGSCYDAWYLKLSATEGYLEAHADASAPPAPMPSFLESVATPAKLTAHLDRLAVSDIRATGVDHSAEFNETLSVLTRLFVRQTPVRYRVEPQLRQALLDVIERNRDPVTGFWGQRYREGSGEVFAPDISTTFHIVSYLKGKVPDMGRILETTLRSRDLDYPEGWRWRGGYWDHINMDVVTIFKYAWPTASASQRKRMANDIDQMLAWCLQQSLQPDGSFKGNIADGSVEDAEYYGASFLSRTGFFDPAKRFWTDRRFPEAAEVKQRILAFAQRHRSSSSSGDAYASTFEALGVSLPGDPFLSPD